MMKMLPFLLSLLLGWTEVVKTQSRRQSGLVCSLLVLSHLLSAAVGEGCVQGMLPAGTVDMYGPLSRNAELSNTLHPNTLYTYPSMNFSCNGTITDIRMRMQQSPGLSQEVVVYFLLFHDGLNSPTRRVSYILLNQTNTHQEFPNQIWNNSDPLSLPVTEGTYVGFAIPTQLSPTIWSKTINFSPTSETVEAHTHHIALGANYNYSGFEGRVLEAARTAHSSQFTPWIISLPLIDIIFRPSPGPSRPTPTSPPSEATPSMPSQLVTIVTAVVTSTVLLVVVVVVVVAVVVMVTVLCRRRGKDGVHEGADANRGVRFQVTQNTIKSTAYYEPKNLNVDPTHFHHQPHPLHTPYTNTTPALSNTDNGDHIPIQDCPAYQPIEDTPTTGEYTYI